VISTVADVRNTMFMSGLTPFPAEYWGGLGEAMRQQAALHAKVSGHLPRGPLKHFWGEAERCVGEDRPFSLWLALGVPFEVVGDLPRDGWTFLSDFDARELADSAREADSVLVCRDTAARRPVHAVALAETLPELFAWKRRIAGQLTQVPHVVEDEPAVCAWYPTAGQVIVWNLSGSPKALTVRAGAHDQVVHLGPLEAQSARIGA
jgi:hypothetical protein